MISPSRLWLTRIVTRAPRSSYSFTKYSMRPCQTVKRIGEPPFLIWCSDRRWTNSGLRVVKSPRNNQPRSNTRTCLTTGDELNSLASHFIYPDTCTPLRLPRALRRTTPTLAAALRLPPPSPIVFRSAVSSPLIRAASAGSCKTLKALSDMALGLTASCSSSGTT